MHTEAHTQGHTGESILNAESSRARELIVIHFVIQINGQERFRCRHMLEEGGNFQNHGSVYNSFFIYIQINLYHNRITNQQTDRQVREVGVRRGRDVYFFLMRRKEARKEGVHYVIVM